MVGFGGGLVAFQSLSTTTKAQIFSTFNRMSSFQSFYDNKQPFQNFYHIHFGKIRGVGVGKGFHPLITLNLTKGTRISHYLSNEPPTRFIRSPYYIYLTCPGAQHTTLAFKVWGEVVFLKDIIYGHLSIKLEKMAV